MTASESREEYLQKWEEGTRMVFSFSVVPGGAILGYGVGMMSNQPVSFATAGLGLGVLLWGLIMSVRRRR